MLRYSVKRLGLALVIVSVAMLLLFCMIYLIPGDPAAVALGPRATEAMREGLRIKMGLDKPVWVQFWNFFSAAWQGDLGRGAAVPSRRWSWSSFHTRWHSFSAGSAGR